MARTRSRSDWQELPLGELAKIERGKFSARPRNDPKFYGGNIPFIQTGDVRNSNGRITTYSQTLNQRGLKVSKLFPAGTLFMTIAANIGDLGIAEFASACPDSLVAMRPRRGVNQGWLYYALSAKKSELEAIATSNAQANLNLEKLNPFVLDVPSQPEQQAIAGMLDDADDLIATLERLIAKKQAIKQGMMQQLLTGRIRLPGFGGSWARAQLGDVLTVRHGRSQKAVETPAGSIPILATGGQIGWADRPLYGKPSVLIGRKGTIDRPQFQDRPFWTVDTLFYTEISAAADPRYLYYLFLTVDWRSMNEASGVPSLSSTRIEGVEIQLPELKEQVAIRETLEDAAHEQRALKSKLGKTRDIKTGMMQQLLTGRTRLPAVAAS